MISSGVNTRELILEILLQIEEEGEHSHIAIRNALSKYQFLPKQERSFITRDGRESVCVRCAMNIHNASDSGGGSLRDLLGRNIGRRASASFLVGSYRLVRQEGILEAVGTDYLVLRQGDFSTGCDLYALKFIEFHDDPPA